jgi:hypothetical protein
LPEFGDEKSGQGGVVGKAYEAGVEQWRGVVGKTRGSKAGEETEGEIKTADKERGGKPQGASGNAEVGDQPEGFGRECGSKASDEEFELGLGEAVEKEVGDDEVVGFCGEEGEGVGVVGSQTVERVGSGGFGVAAKKLEHGEAGVYGVGVEM